MLVKALRKIVDCNKGFFTFWLVMVFLGALCIKNIAPVISYSLAKVYVAHSGYKYDLAAISDGSSNDFFDRFEKDLDSDNLEFIPLENLYSKVNFPLQEKHQFTISQLQQQAKNDMLYDLYCNWKFHLF